MLWGLQAPERFPARVAKALCDPANSVHVSVVSFWEISLKAGLGKLILHGADAGDFPRFVTEAGWEIHPMSAEVAASLGRLPQLDEHLEPFDRLIMWTAISEGFSLVSRDRAFSRYSGHRVMLCW